MTRRSLTKTLIAAAASLTLLVTHALPAASADYPHSDTGESFAGAGGFLFGAPDNSNHTYCYGVAGSETWRFTWSLDHWDGATNIATTGYWGCGPNDDIQFEYGYVFNNGWGSAECINWAVWGTVCDKHAVIINKNQLSIEFQNDPYGYDLNMYYTIVHEAGHTLGLTHMSPIEAMKVVPAGPPNYDWNYTNISAHDVCHVNAWLAWGYAGEC